MSVKRRPSDPGVAAIVTIQKKYAALAPILDERQRRLWAAAEALALGWGGVSRVMAATGISRKTIRSGIRELERPLAARPRARAAGGGRKPLISIDMTLERDLMRLCQGANETSNAPSLRWTDYSTRQLAQLLSAAGHQVTPRTVSRLLTEHDYRLRPSHAVARSLRPEERAARCQHINQLVAFYYRSALPILRAELHRQVQLRKSGESENEATWHARAVDNASLAFAAEAVAQGCRELAILAPATIASGLAKQRRALLIVEDGGDSAALRQDFKQRLVPLCEREQLELLVCHAPALTSRWDRIGPQLLFYSATQTVQRGRQHHRDGVQLELMLPSQPARRSRPGQRPELPPARGARVAQWSYVVSGAVDGSRSRRGS